MTSNAPAASAISFQSISKNYGNLAAVKDLSFDVRPGEILGFLGLNGAGKTTTIRMLLDLLRPTTGKAFIFGKDCQTDGLEARRQTGYLPGEMGIYPDMTGAVTLNLLADLNKKPVNTSLRGELQERLGLSNKDLGRKLREYSTGMKRKLGLIQAFESDPHLFILDEPTEGLDPLVQESFYELLTDVRRRGKTVFMSSHVLHEVERVCDRIALLRKGELVLLSTVDEIPTLAPRRVRVTFAESVKPIPSLPAGHKVLTLDPAEWDLQIEGNLGPLMRYLAGLPVKDISVQEPRLEDVLIKYYREDEQ